MILPSYLKKGDTIAFAAPARKISIQEVSYAKNWLEKLGFKVLFAENLFAEDHQFAGSDAVRTRSFQKLLDNPEIKAIFCVRGGYGTVRIIDQLDFSFFLEHPKWICGYSDVTVFHSHILQNYRIATLHSTMPFNMNEENPENNTSLIHLLSGEKMSYCGLSPNQNHFGKAIGKIVGGNLSILYSLLGSPSDIDTNHKILFIEDLDEYLYHIDRMIVALKRAHKFDHLEGLIIGGMNRMHDNEIPFGKDAIEIILEHCKKFDFPIITNFPAGHTQENIALKLGVSVSLSVDENGWNLIEL